MDRFVAVSVAFMLSLTVLDAASGHPAATPAYVTAALDSPARKEDAGDDAHRQIAAIMTFTQVKPGQKVAELIPAHGYWTRVFSAIVGPRGHVYTLWPDPYQQYVDDSYAVWQKLVATPEYANVSLLRGPAAEFKLPESVDLVFTNQNYHDYHDKFMGPVDMAAFDKQIFDSLKPGGVFVVIDNVAPAGSGFSATDTTHRVDPEAVKQEVESVGFVFDGSSDVLKNPADTHTLVSYTPPMAGHDDQFIFRFRKPAH
jgi:predicted methyltransferase